jgi:Zn-dependent protease with chaperone function
MDFFEAQDNAIRKTRRLVGLYLLAVLAIVVAVYFAVTAGMVVYRGLAHESQGPAQDAVAMPLWDPWRLLYTAAGVVLSVGLGSGLKILSLRGGGAVVANTLGGRLVERDTRDPKRRQLLNVVEEMAIASGVPVPEVYLLPDEPSINAFAAGWGTHDAVIAVSAGALQQLSRDELQGVVAHEYSHVLYGDCRLNIRLMGLLYGIMMLTVFAQLLRLLLRGGRGVGRRGPVLVGRGGKGGGKGGGGALILAVLLVIVLVTIIGYIGTFFGRLIQAAISRQREFLADAAAVQFTRNPDGISGALKRIAAHAEHGVLSHPHASEAAHMFFADGLQRPFASALATHPPLKARIRRIQPDWDGEVEAAAPSTPAEQVAVAATAPPATGVQPAGDFISGMAVIGAIGTLGQSRLAAARRLTESIPESLDQPMRTPQGARHAVIGLLIVDNPDDNAEQWRRIESAVPAGELPALRSTVEAVSRLPRPARLGALELAATTLTQAGAAERANLQQLIDQLITADDKLSLYEACVRRILRERLTRGDQAPAAASRVHYLELKPEVARAAGVLLAIVAREAAGRDDPESAIQDALADLYLLRGKVPRVAPAESGIDKLDTALDTLRRSAFALRAQCLRAVVHCIKQDGNLTAEEAEVLRMISLGLDCPAPLLES